MRAEEAESRGPPVAPYGSVGWHQQWPCLRDRSTRMASVIFSFGADDLHIRVSRVRHRNFTWVLEQWDIPLCTVPQIASRKRTLGNREGGKKQKFCEIGLVEHLRLWHWGMTLSLNTASCAWWQEGTLPVLFRGRCLRCLLPHVLLDHDNVWMWLIEIVYQGKLLSSQVRLLCVDCGSLSYGKGNLSLGKRGKWFRRPQYVDVYHPII